MLCSGEARQTEHTGNRDKPTRDTANRLLRAETSENIQMEDSSGGAENSHADSLLFILIHRNLPWFYVLL